MRPVTGRKDEHPRSSLTLKTSRYLTHVKRLREGIGKLAERIEPLLRVPPPELVRRRRSAWRRDGEVFVYANNDWEGFAFKNAAWLRDHLA